jgi:hypothetical protein
MPDIDGEKVETTSNIYTSARRRVDASSVRKKK